MVIIPTFELAIEQIKTGSVNENCQAFIELYIEELTKVCPDPEDWTAYEQLMYSYLKGN